MQINQCTANDMELIMIFQSDVNDFIRLLSTIMFCDAIIQQVFEISQYFRNEQFMKTLMATIFCERNLYIKYHKVLMICSLITLRLFEESTVKLLVEQCNLIDLMSEVLNMLQNCDTSQQIDEKLLAITFEEILWLIVPICNESNQYKEILVSQNCISKIFNILKKFKEWSSSTEFILYEVFNQLLYGRFLGTEEELSQALNFCVQNTVSFLNKLDEDLCFKTDKSEVFQEYLNLVKKSCYHILLQFKLKQNYLNEILETFENLANLAYKDAFDLELYDAVQCKFIEGAQDRTGLEIFIEIMDYHKENKTIQEICDNIMETMLCPSEFDDLIFKPEDNNNSISNHKQQFSI
eukprot:403363854